MMYYLIVFYKAERNAKGKTIKSSYTLVSQHTSLEEAQEVLKGVQADYSDDFEAPPVIAQQVS